MSVQPKISFVITTYNAEAHIGETIKSLLEVEETFPYEIVIVDDGSDDKTAEVCNQFTKNEVRIRFYSEGRIGRAKALNRAIQYASGEYIAINDADDKSCPGRLGLVVPYLEGNHEAVLVSTDCIKAPEGLLFNLSMCDLPGRGMRISEINPSDLYCKNSITHSTVIFRKDSWLKCGGYNENLDVCIDYDFYFRMLSLGKIIHLNSVTVWHLLSKGTFFKRKSVIEFLYAYFSVKRGARRVFDIPIKLYACDVKIFLYLVQSLVHKRIETKSARVG
jgi:glycosyltransferase involved in cell wall biosynthesis